MESQLRVAAVSTLPYDGEDEYKNARQALGHLEEAARQGADLVCFPEGYPGPCFGPMDSDGRLPAPPVELLADGARRHGVWVNCGNLEPSEDYAGAYYLTSKLISPSGHVVANYRRTQPTTPVLNAALYGGKSHVLPGDELVVAETDFGLVGLLICSELFVPELARIEMLMGAELILAPIGGIHRGPPKGGVPIADLSTERCVARARAAENLLYVITTLNLFSPEWKRGSFVAGPEQTIAAADEPGIVYAELDLDRIRYLRSRYTEPEDVNPTDESAYLPHSVKYGIIHERRPELYARLVEPQADAYDYFYFRRDFDAWCDEYDKVRRFRVGSAEPDKVSA